MERLPLNLDVNTYRSLQTIAAAEHETIDGIIRDAISRDIARRRRAAETNRIQTVRARAELKGRLAPDFRMAKNWADLDRKLGIKGYAIVTIAQEMVLQDADHITVCSLAMLGHSDMQLLRRFGPRAHHQPMIKFSR